jgi:hypothetical protein
MSWYVIVENTDNTARVRQSEGNAPNSPDITECIECNSRQEAFDVVLTHGTYNHLYISLPMTLDKALSLVRNPKYPGPAAIERVYYQGAKFDSNGFPDRPEWL